MAKYRKRTGTLFIVFLTLLMLNLWQGELAIQKRIEINKQAETSTKLVSLNLKNTGKVNNLKKEVSAERQARVKSDREVIRRKKVAIIYQHYRDSGEIYKYPWITPDYLYKIILAWEKYHYLYGDYYFDYLDPEDFFLCWCANGFNFAPNRTSKNYDDSYDKSLADLNQCNWWMFDKVKTLCPELKDKNWTDQELAVAAWCFYMSFKQLSVWEIWAGSKQHRARGYRKDVRELFFKLREGVK